MAKYNPHSQCQFPEPVKFDHGNSLIVTNFVYEPHPQDYDEFQVDSTFIMFVVISGECDFHTDYSDFSLSVGDCAFTFPQKRYKLDGMKDLELMYISFANPEALHLLTSLDISYVNPVRSGLQNSIKHFLHEFSRSHDMRASQLVPKGLLYYALSHFEKIRDVESSCDKQALVKDILKYVDAHYAEKCDSFEISAAFHFNYNYISQIFKEITGTTFVKHLRNVRIKNAKKLLSETSRSVAEIAFAVGFSDPHYFEKVFKQYTNITATQFRNLYSVR